MRSLRTVLALGALSTLLAAQVPIRNLPYVIETPGAYRLTRTLGPSEYGIYVKASHVTIDLRGYALIGSDTSGDGIFVNGSQTDVAVLNGTITGWGAHGIRAEQGLNMHLSDLRLDGNGRSGALLGSSAVVEGVVIQSNGCTGLVAQGELVASGLTSIGNGGYGIEAGDGSILTGNVLAGNFGGGVFLVGDGRITGNTATGNGKLAPPEALVACTAGLMAGIAVTGDGAVVEDNLVSGNAIGLRLEGQGTLVRDNLVQQNAVNYQFAPGNLLELLVSELPLRVEWPALLKFPGTLTGLGGQHGIVVAADGVTIDLGGHGLLALAEANEVCGILVENEVQGLIVRNGFVRGWPACGVNAKLAKGGLFEGLLLEANGVQGLSAGDGSVVRDVVARENLVDGVHTGTDCMVLSSSFTKNGNDGLQLGEHSQASDCVASENVFFGIRAMPGAMVKNSTASRNNMGIAVIDGATVEGCTASFNTLIGIRAERASVVTGNTADHNATNIAIVDGPGAKVTHNNVTAGDIGLLLAGTGNLAYCNTAAHNVTNYQVADGNAVALIRDVAHDPAFWVNDAWANLSF